MRLGNATQSDSYLRRGPVCEDRPVSDAWFIQPNGPLVGDVQVHGSKNAVTKHMVAALLGDGPSTIANVPEVGDVEITTEILRAIGAGVDQDATANSS